MRVREVVEDEEMKDKARKEISTHMSEKMGMKKGLL
jgi:hypothetical protein